MTQPLRKSAFNASVEIGVGAPDVFELGRIPASGDSPALALQRELHARYALAPIAVGQPFRLGVRMLVIGGMAAGLWTVLGAVAVVQFG